MKESVSVLNYARPTRLKGLAKISRRMQQAWTILFAHEFSSYTEMQPTAVDLYDVSVEKSHWQAFADYGLEPYELRAIGQAMRALGKDSGQTKVLMVGRGAGREAFGMEKLGMQVTAADTATGLIEFAGRHAEKIKSTVRFERIEPNQRLPQVEGGYDIVFVTNILLNLIPGRHARRQFLHRLREVSGPATQIILFADILKPSIGERFFWISQLMRLRSVFGADFEPGDTASGQLTSAHAGVVTSYYHYFPDQKALLEELHAAGMTAINPWGIFWLARLC